MSETWWHLFEEKTDSKNVFNNSWSGLTICNTGYNGCDCSHTSSFIHRLDDLIENGLFVKNSIDTVFVFGASGYVQSFRALE